MLILNKKKLVLFYGLMAVCFLGKAQQRGAVKNSGIIISAGALISTGPYAYSSITYGNKKLIVPVKERFSNDGLQLKLAKNIKLNGGISLEPSIGVGCIFNNQFQLRNDEIKKTVLYLPFVLDVKYCLAAGNYFKHFIQAGPGYSNINIDVTNPENTYYEKGGLFYGAGYCLLHSISKIGVGINWQTHKTKVVQSFAVNNEKQEIAYNKNRMLLGVVISKQF